jgi:cell division control protein 6
MVKTDILENIFEDFFRNAKIFKNREVLHHDYLPSYFPHREKQIRQLGETLAPVLHGSRCSNIFIYGKTGTGKTAVTKYVLWKLIEKANEINASVKKCYINCRLIGTEYRIFVTLCSSLGVSVPFTGLSVSEVFDRFRLALDSYKLVLLITLDEIDAMVKTRGDSLLYELTRINETLRSSKVSIIGISNDLKFKEFLDPRVLSSLSEEEIVFRPYDAAELKNILLERAKLAFFDGVLTDGAISLCAALAAAEHGDARRALDLLRVAGEVAERRGDEKITEEHIREAEKRIEHNRVVESLKNLTLHSKMVLFSVYQLNKANINRAITGDIYEVYCELCGEIGLVPLTQRRVSSLINELDAIGLLSARIESMGRYGRTKKIKLGIARSIIRKVFSQDERLGRLINYELQCLPKTTRSRY